MHWDKDCGEGHSSMLQKKKRYYWDVSALGQRSWIKTGTETQYLERMPNNRILDKMPNKKCLTKCLMSECKANVSIHLYTCSPTCKMWTYGWCHRRKQRVHKRRKNNSCDASLELIPRHSVFQRQTSQWPEREGKSENKKLPKNPTNVSDSKTRGTQKGHSESKKICTPGGNPRHIYETWHMRKRRTIIPMDTTITLLGRIKRQNHV